MIDSEARFLLKDLDLFILFKGSILSEELGSFGGIQDLVPSEEPDPHDGVQDLS